MLGDKSREAYFESIYRECYYDVYRISLYYTKNEEEAQDITQKVFYEFYHHINEINLDCAKAYMLRAARNLSYNWLRDTKKEREGEPIENVSEEKFTVRGAEASYLRKERERETREFLSTLMEQLRQENEMWYDILNLVYCLDVSHDDAAKELGISKSVLYSKLYRAKQWIRKHYAEQYRDLIG